MFLFFYCIVLVAPGAKPGTREAVTHPKEIHAGVFARAAARHAQTEHGSPTGEPNLFFLELNKAHD